MDFKLNQEQEMLQRSARDFLKAQCDTTVVRDLLASDRGFKKKLWKKMASLDWMAILVPEEFGGVDLSLLDQGLLCEEFGRAAIPGPMFCNIMATLAIVDGASQEQKAALLPAVAAGKRILTFALDEPGVQYDLSHVSVRADRVPDGYTISGTKLYVPYANIADLIITFVRTGREPGNPQGLSLFMIDPASPGITLEELKTTAGDKQFAVRFENVVAAERDLLGVQNEAFGIGENVLAKAATLQCAEMLGGAEKELEMTAAYMKERVQFGRPLGAFQAVQHRLADMYIDVQGARWATYNALWRLSEGIDAKRQTAIAKYFVSKAVSRVAYSAQQLHGGMGIDLDYDLHLYYKRAKAFEVKLGTQNQHLSALESALGL